MGRRSRRRAAHSAASLPRRRRLLIEPLEDRRLLAVATVTTLADTVDFNDGVTSLREAIFATNTVGGADTIEFDPSLTASGPATILFTQGELAITDSLTINGPGANLLSIDASGNDPTPDSTWDDGIGVDDGDGSRVFTIDNNSAALSDVEIAGLQITGGDTNEPGGGIYTSENLTLRESIVVGNMTGSNFKTGGGGIYSVPSSFNVPNSLTVIDSMIVKNVSFNAEGGGIRKATGSLTAERSVIEGNVAGEAGGGISAANDGVVVVIHDSLIRENKVRIGLGESWGGCLSI